MALLWSGLGHIHILAMGCGAVEIGGIGKGSSKPSFESGGLFGDDGLRARKGGRQKDFVLLKWKSDTTWKAERKTETGVS